MNNTTDSECPGGRRPPRRLPPLDSSSIPLTLFVLLAGAALLAGCVSHDGPAEIDLAGPFQHYVQAIEYPDLHEDPAHLDPRNVVRPPSVRRPEETEKWPLTLEEAVRIALERSQVFRDLGGRVVAAPAAASSVYDPALQAADPRFGEEAALAAFDAQFSTHLFLEQSDRAFNNIFFGGGAPGLLQHLGDFQLGVTKTAATGTQFSLENITGYNRNDAPPNRFPSVYDTVFQATVRHPLMQGSGVEFNRIAGPHATPGNYQGVLIARLNSDIALTDFEAAVRDLLRDVERTYWELYFAYRDLDAKMTGRQLALRSWELEKNRVEAGEVTPDQEAFVRQQYYAAQIAVENALSGNRNGTGGVYAVERELRRLMGLPTSDGRLIVPADEPLTVEVQFDWHGALESALFRRVELRRQRWNIKRRELELIAARNFEKMRVDLVGQYRWRGFGDDLLGDRGFPQGSAIDDLFDGNLQDWRVGVEIRTPVGNRAGHAAVRHAELQLAREHAVAEELERQIVHEVNAAFTELDRAHAVSRSNYNLRIASQIRLNAEQVRERLGESELDLVLDAQRVAVDAESGFWRAVIDYNLALLDLQVARGTLLDHMQVALAEGPWSGAAHDSAVKLSRRFRYKSHGAGLHLTPPLSAGLFPQQRDAPSEPPALEQPAAEPLPAAERLRMPEPL